MIRCQPVVKTIRELVDAPVVVEKEIESVMEKVEEAGVKQVAEEKSEEKSEEQSAVELAETKDDELVQAKDDELVQVNDDERTRALLDALESNLVLVYDLETGEIVSTSSAKDSDLLLDSTPPPPGREPPASLKNLEDLAKVVRCLPPARMPELTTRRGTDARIHRRRSPRARGPRPPPRHYARPSSFRRTARPPRFHPPRDRE